MHYWEDSFSTSRIQGNGYKQSPFVFLPGQVWMKDTGMNTIRGNPLVYDLVTEEKLKELQGIEIMRKT